MGATVSFPAHLSLPVALTQLLHPGANVALDLGLDT